MAYRRTRSSAFAHVVIVMIASTTVGGCHLYHVGSRTLYAPDVATVYVPIIESESMRPHLAQRLNEAVIKEILWKTPYRIAATADADSTLSCRITGSGRNVLVENFFDQPRELELNLQVEVNWLSRRQIPIRQATLEVPAELIGIGQTATLIPEAGESVASAEQEAIDRLAEQIVSAMEQPW